MLRGREYRWFDVYHDPSDGETFRVSWVLSTVCSCLVCVFGSSGPLRGRHFWDSSVVFEFEEVSSRNCKWLRVQSKLVNVFLTRLLIIKYFNVVTQVRRVPSFSRDWTLSPNSNLRSRWGIFDTLRPVYKLKRFRLKRIDPIYRSLKMETSRNILNFPTKCNLWVDYRLCGIFELCYIRDWLRIKPRPFYRVLEEGTKSLYYFHLGSVYNGE